MGALTLGLPMRFSGSLIGFRNTLTQEKNQGMSVFRFYEEKRYSPIHFKCV